jgi:hypothetical protein
METLARQFELEMSKASDDGGSPSEARASALERGAATLAGKRKNGLPRMGRQSLSDRTSAVATLVGLVFGEVALEERDENDAVAVERFIGSDRGRRFRPNGVDPWNDGPAIDGLEQFARHARIGHLLDLVRTASEDDLEQARAFALVFVQGIALFARMTDASFGRDNVSGMTAMSLISDDPSVGIFMPAMLLSLTAEAGGIDHLTTIINALSGAVDPAREAVSDFLAQTGAERERREALIKALPFDQQAGARRLIQEFGLDASRQT